MVSFSKSRRRFVYGVSALAGLVLAACQTYDFAYQPLQDRQGRHLRFEVQTPSRADLLFMVDNSSSMTEEQAALSRSFDALIQAFGETDTSYRVALVSSDGVGFTQDCDGNELPPEGAFNADNHGARGNCNRSDVELRRPHDGALGRVLAAYDPTVFDINSPLFASLTSDQKTALQKLFPNSATTNADQVSANGEQGVPWVIDRDIIRRDACIAAGCGVCDKTDTCYKTKAEPVAGALVKAYFTSNIAGLGIAGIGWEEGIRTSLLAVGVDARAPTGSEISDSFSLTALGRPNSHVGLDANFQPREQSWIRDDAALGIMYVTDEQDCSMPVILWQNRANFEEDAVPVPQPLGSMCYQNDAQFSLLSTSSMSNLLKQKKGNSNGRVVIGTIAALRKNGPDINPTLAGIANDCIEVDAAAPNTNCSCLEGESDLWCAYTDNTNVSDERCSALSGSRYVDFSSQFTRKTYESICRGDTAAYSDALRTFADLAKLACFQLADVVPAGTSDDAKANNISVRRAEAGASGQPSLLPRVDPDGTDAGWYYRADENQVCLVGRERVIGDVYDIFVTTVDEVDFTR
jgi:hypothetical protein